MPVPRTEKCPPTVASRQFTRLIAVADAENRCRRSYIAPFDGARRRRNHDERASRVCLVSCASRVHNATRMRLGAIGRAGANLLPSFEFGARAHAVAPYSFVLLARG